MHERLPPRVSVRQGSAMGARTKRRHQQGEASRAKILDATTEIAAERGYEGTSINLVSKRSGLPASSIYWHFQNKDELIAAVIQRSFDTWMAGNAARLGLPVGDSRLERLVDAVQTEAGSLTNNPDFLRLGLMLALEHRPEEPKAREIFLKVRHEAFERILLGIRFFMESEGLPRDDVAADRIARFTLASVDGIFIANQADGAAMSPLLETLATVLNLLIEDALRHP